MSLAWGLVMRGFYSTWISLAALTLSWALCASPTFAAQEPDLRHLSQTALDDFIRAMPKGGELHVHLGGLVPAAIALEWASEDGECIDLGKHAVRAPPCPDYGLARLDRMLPLAIARSGAWQHLRGWMATLTHNSPEVLLPASQALADHAFRQEMLDSLTVRPTQSGGQPEKFFSVFNRVELLNTRFDDQLALLMDERAREHAYYLEVSTPGILGEVMPAALQAAGWRNDLPAMKMALTKAGLEDFAARSIGWTDWLEAQTRQRLKCGMSGTHPGCAVEVRFLVQTDRNLPPAALFAQINAGVAVVQEDKRWVGLQMAGPEADPRALKAYRQDMAMLDFLTDHGRAVKETLHSGELALRDATPADRHFHVRLAVEEAGAARVGHAADIAGEDDADALAVEMAAKPVLVEINLSSNDAMLGLRGKAHPFGWLKAHGVPMALSTDDPGILDIDLSHEYARAVREQGANYADLKQMARNALAFSFLPGGGLWNDPGRYRIPATPCAVSLSQPLAPDSTCAAFLSASEKAAQQWRLEQDFVRFETSSLFASALGEH